MATADLTVMGAGILGLAVAAAAGARGARVQVIDPAGVAAGASGGVVGALAPFAPPTDPAEWTEVKVFQLEALVMAEGFWTEVARLTGADPGYARTGRLQPLSGDKAVARADARKTAAARLWPETATWEIVPADGDWAPVSDSGRMVRDTLSARLHPVQACAALAAAVEAQGGAVLREGDVAGPVIWATGVAGLEELSEFAGHAAGGAVKGQAALLRFDAAGLPQISAPGLHVVPHVDGTVGIGSTSEKDWAHGDTTDGQLDEVVARARAVMPALADAPVIRRWAGLRPRAATGLPMLGAHPFRQNAWIANGGFKIGFGLAPLIGEVMADLVLEGRDRIPNGFRPDRSL